MAEWQSRLEGDLARELSPVAAPDSLWERIHEQRRPLRVQRPLWTTWSIAIASLLVLLAGLVWRLGATRNPQADLDGLARLELRNVTNGTEKLDIRSGDRGEIQRWVQAKLGLDLQLSEGAVQLCGARIFRSDRFAGAAIAYRVGKEPATTIIAAQPETADARHTSFHSRYAIASADTGRPQRPCLLCHAGV